MHEANGPTEASMIVHGGRGLWSNGCRGRTHGAGGLSLPATDAATGETGVAQSSMSIIYVKYLACKQWSEML